jgi:hypothetical protein
VVPVMSTKDDLTCPHLQKVYLGTNTKRAGQFLVLSPEYVTWSTVHMQRQFIRTADVTTGVILELNYYFLCEDQRAGNKYRSDKKTYEK